MAPPHPYTYICSVKLYTYIHGACQSNLYTSIPPPLNPRDCPLFSPSYTSSGFKLKKKKPPSSPLGCPPQFDAKKNSPVNTTFFIRKNACPLTKKNSAIYHTLQQGGGASWHRRICMRLKQNKIIRLGVLLVGRVYGPEVLATWCGWI